MFHLYRVHYSPKLNAIVRRFFARVPTLDEALATAAAGGPGTYRVLGPDDTVFARIQIAHPEEAVRQHRAARLRKKG